MANADERAPEPEAKPDPTDTPTPAEVAADPSNRKQPTGETQAAANRDVDPSA